MQTPESNEFSPAQLVRAREWQRLSIAERDGEAGVILSALDKELGEKKCDRLVELVEREADTKTNGKTSAPAEAAQNTPAATDENGLPELLPFSKLPGYLIDAWGVPWRVKGQGRKEGKVTPDNRLYRDKAGNVVHIARYRLTIKGKQDDFMPRFLLRSRLHAEQEYRERQREKLGYAENGKGEVRVY